LRERGYESCELSKFEIENFILLSRTHNDVSECANRIVSYREYEEKYELEKYLKQKSTMDSRFYNIMKYIKAISFSPNSIKIKLEDVEEIERKVNDFNSLLEDHKLITYNHNNKSDYREMLYSAKDLLSYHKESA